jgi:hypothetical protein
MSYLHFSDGPWYAYWYDDSVDEVWDKDHQMFSLWHENGTQLDWTYHGCQSLALPKLITVYRCSERHAQMALTAVRRFVGDVERFDAFARQAEQIRGEHQLRRESV